MMFTIFTTLFGGVLAVSLLAYIWIAGKEARSKFSEEEQRAIEDEVLKH